MPVTRKRKQTNIADNPNKKPCEVNKIFDSEDDELILSAMSSTASSQDSPVLPTNHPQSAQVRPPLPMQSGPSRLPGPFVSAGNVAVRPPPPQVVQAAAAKKNPDSPATSSDIDRLMSSIGALTGKFDEVKQDITGVASRLDDHTNRLNLSLIHI